MPIRGIVGLKSSQTTAVQDDWAAVVYHAQGALSFGGVLTNALRRFDASLVALCVASLGRCIATTDDAAKTALRALASPYAADVRPVPVYGQTATQWTLVADPWSYAGSMLQTVCLPQLSRRTVGAMVDKVLTAAPLNGVVLVDQDAGKLLIWADFNGDTADALAGFTATGATVATEFAGPYPPLIFEGGPT